jgi:pyruvate kinase
MRFVPLDGRGFQIIATLGPASLPRAAELAGAGATSFRINASHMTPDGARAAVAQVRAVLPEAPVVIDLQGGKMRLGELRERDVETGARVVFSLERSTGEPDAIVVPHPELFASARPGDTMSCDDDRLRFRVTSTSPSSMELEALTAGRLRPRKGINVMEHPVALGALTAVDAAFLDALSGFDALSWAFSFMRDGQEVQWVRARSPGPVIGKIEIAEALPNLDRIAAAAAAIWICRGDLGAQLGMARLATVVASIEPARLACPVIMAGQVLEHLTAHAEPTRSEVCHLHDLVARGFAGIVLSDETAIGHDPVGAVTRAAALTRAFAATRTAEPERVR